MKSHRWIFALVCLALTAFAVPTSQGLEPAGPNAAGVGRGRAFTVPDSYQSFVSDEGEGLPDSYAKHGAGSAGSCAPNTGCTDALSPSCVPCGTGVLCDPWVTLEYMHAWTRGRQLPPLVTTAPANVPSPTLANPSTEILFGNEDVGDGLRSAGKLSFGFWLGQEQQLGVAGKFSILEGSSAGFAAASDSAGSPMLGRPYFNTQPFNEGPFALIVTRPGERSGDIRADADNDVLMAEVYARYLLLTSCRGRLDLLVGYQFARVDDSLTISHRMRQLSGSAAGTRFEFEDVFDAENQFHGSQLGLLGEVDTGRVTFSALAKLGLGNMHETVQIAGQTSVQALNQANPVTFPGALLALPTNIGTYERNEFTLMPEVELKMIYRLTPRLDFSLGYSFTYFDHVAFAADQIDTSSGSPTVNNTQIPLLGGVAVPPANPALDAVRSSDFWLQGINFGLTFKM
jgi:hypothetical protein